MYKKIIAVMLLTTSLFGNEIIDAKKDFDNKKYVVAYDKFLKIARSGMVAKYNIGFMHEYGLGVKKDINKALIFYKMSANDGYDVAQNNLGNAYLKGIGVKQDLKIAIRYYKLAAKQKNKNAITTLKMIEKKMDIKK